jgi:hypothetical protein
LPIVILTYVARFFRLKKKIIKSNAVERSGIEAFIIGLTAKSELKYETKKFFLKGHPKVV